MLLEHFRLVLWSQEVLLHTQKVSIWCLRVNLGTPSVSLQNQWIQEDCQKFLTFSQLFTLKKWIFLAWKMVRNFSDAFKNIPSLFFEIRRWFYIPTKSGYDVYKSTWRPHLSSYKINEFKRIVRNFWLPVNFFPWRSGFSLYESLSGSVLMCSKALQTCYLKSGDGFRYPESHHTSFRNEYAITFKNPPKRTHRT